jgi:acetyl-CoA C-acetyltransferase
MPHPELVADATGPATVETYTVTYDREGVPALGIVIARLDDGRRCIANVPAEDRALLESMTAQEFVGQPGAVEHDGAAATNRFSA